MSSLQHSLVKATSAVSLTMNNLLSAREQKSIPDYKDLIAKLIDSAVLLGHVSSELTFKRRDFLRPYLTNEFYVKPGYVKPAMLNQATIYLEVICLKLSNSYGLQTELLAMLLTLQTMVFLPREVIGPDLLFKGRTNRVLVYPKILLEDIEGGCHTTPEETISSHTFQRRSSQRTKFC
eukprot:gene6605-7354_t